MQPEPLRHSLEKVASRAYVRVHQFARGLRATVTEQELQRASARLPHAAFGLFLLQPTDAQRHSLNVLAALERGGPVAPDLAAAALLHDVGKLAAAQAGHPISLWLRGPLVLLDAFAPALRRRLASADPRSGWRYALHVHQEHAAIGALWAQEAGCAPRTCWLIAHHQADEAEGPALDLADLRRLQRADGLN
jgi:hypothetical protein